MCLNTLNHKPQLKRALILIEVVTALFIASYVFLGAWAMFTMSWSWWHEIAPRIEAERIARISLLAVIDGNADTTTGTYTVGASVYSRRNGIAWATMIDDIPQGQTAQAINFGIEPDTSKARSFYLGTDVATGLKVVYYKDGNSALHEIKPTLGIEDLRFEKFMTDDGFYLDNVIKVTVTVTKNVTGTRTATYPVTVTYSDSVFLRSMQ